MSDDPDWSPLSRSPVWEWQRQYFLERGIRAWSSGEVPHYITSNPAIAEAYSRVLSAWSRDCTDDQPIYIVELGAGSGRLAYQMLRRLRSRNLRYVMTDFCDATIQFWRSHTLLKPYVDSGALDFARFDPDRDREIELLVSGKKLVSANPLAVIANYVFDGIPHDAFTIIDGKLHECRVAVPADGGGLDRNDPGFFGRLDMQVDHRQVCAGYYENPSWNDVLRRYEQRLDNTTVMFPIAALRCIDNLAALSDGRLLVLSADRGHDREEALMSQTTPRLASHGSFSLPVNYDAIGRVAMASGWEFLHAAHAPVHLCVVALTMGGNYANARQEFEDAVCRRGPDEFFLLKKGIEKLTAAFDLDELIAWLRVSGWDHNYYWHCADSLRTCAAVATPHQREQLLRVVSELWENYFPIGEAGDLAMNLGELLLDLAMPKLALDYFQLSEQMRGPSAATYCSIANAHYHLSDLKAAGAATDRALELDPGNGPARGLRLQISGAGDRFLSPAARSERSTP